MEREAFITAQIKEQAILPLFYHDSESVCTAAVQALYDAGIRSIEFTNRGQQAFSNFAALVQQRSSRWPGLLLGIGTISNRSDADRFIEAGADFLVSPFFDSGVCDAAYLNKIPWLPGCMTPAEIHVAEQAGCSFIKLFPGNTLTPGFVQAVKPLFPGLDFMVTGGVEGTEDSIGSWFAAGVCAVGMGSKLISRQLLDSGNFEQLRLDTANILSIIQRVKS